MPQLLNNIDSIICTFNKYARDDGDCATLSKGELKQLIQKEFAEVILNPYDPETIDTALQLLDQDCDGKVDFEEFTVLVFKVAKACYKKDQECQALEETQSIKGRSITQQQETQSSSKDSTCQPTQELQVLEKGQEAELQCPPRQQEYESSRKSCQENLGQRPEAKSQSSWKPVVERLTKSRAKECCIADDEAGCDVPQVEKQGQKTQSPTQSQNQEKSRRTDRWSQGSSRQEWRATSQNSEKSFDPQQTQTEAQERQIPEQEPCCEAPQVEQREEMRYTKSSSHGQRWGTSESETHNDRWSRGSSRQEWRATSQNSEKSFDPQQAQTEAQERQIPEQEPCCEASQVEQREEMRYTKSSSHGQRWGTSESETHNDRWSRGSSRQRTSQVSLETCPTQRDRRGGQISEQEPNNEISQTERRENQSGNCPFSQESQRRVPKPQTYLDQQRQEPPLRQQQETCQDLHKLSERYPITRESKKCQTDVQEQWGQISQTESESKQEPGTVAEDKCHFVQDPLELEEDLTQECQQSRPQQSQQLCQSEDQAQTGQWHFRIQSRNQEESTQQANCGTKRTPRQMEAQETQSREQEADHCTSQESEEVVQRSTRQRQNHFQAAAHRSGQISQAEQNSSCQQEDRQSTFEEASLYQQEESSQAEEQLACQEEHRMPIQEEDRGQRFRGQRFQQQEDASSQCAAKERPRQSQTCQSERRFQSLRQNQTRRQEQEGQRSEETFISQGEQEETSCGNQPCQVWTSEQQSFQEERRPQRSRTCRSCNEHHSLTPEQDRSIQEVTSMKPEREVRECGCQLTAIPPNQGPRAFSSRHILGSSRPHQPRRPLHFPSPWFSKY